MIGYRPTSMWSFSWRFITLIIVSTIFVMALGQFSSTLKYGSYHYPQWASNGLALFIVLISIKVTSLHEADAGLGAGKSDDSSRVDSIAEKTVVQPGIFRSIF
uniref:Uncharacterized protein n=1 Tax=Romanomermis culicivorax TaxID=13658 RepID=A0A915IYQ9_ROMCU